MVKKKESKKYTKKKIHLERIKKSNIFSSIFTKVNITYFLIGLFDIICVVVCARFNRVQYVKLLGDDIFIGSTKYLVFGRNYVNVVITLFFYLYFLLINKFFFKRKINIKFLVCLFLILFIINILLFSCFSIKVY